MIDCIHSTDYAGCGIYILYNVIDTTAYIGKSENIKARFAAHRALFSSKSKANPMYSQPICNFVFSVIYEMSELEFAEWGDLAEATFIHFALQTRLPLYNSFTNCECMIWSFLDDKFRPSMHISNALKSQYGIHYTSIPRASLRRKLEILQSARQIKEEQA